MGMLVQHTAQQSGIQVLLQRCIYCCCCVSSFTIRVPGYGAVVMELNYICQCECEKPSMAVSLCQQSHLLDIFIIWPKKKKQGHFPMFVS